MQLCNFIHAKGTVIVAGAGKVYCDADLSQEARLALYRQGPQVHLVK